MRKGYVYRNNVRLAWELYPCVDTSSGALPILLIQGWSGVKEDWTSLLITLTRSRDVLIFDNRGVGQSDTPKGMYNPDMMALDALCVKSHVLTPHAPYYVLGISMGGAIAQQLYFLDRQHIHGIAFGCTFSCGFESINNSIQGFGSHAHYRKTNPKVESKAQQTPQEWNPRLGSTKQQRKRWRAAIRHKGGVFWPEKNEGSMISMFSGGGKKPLTSIEKNQFTYVMLSRNYPLGFAVFRSGRDFDALVARALKYRRPVKGIMRQFGVIQQFDARKPLKHTGISCPALVIHGDRDRVVQYMQGVVLYRRIASGKRRSFGSLTNASRIDLSPDFQGFTNDQVRPQSVTMLTIPGAGHIFWNLSEYLQVPINRTIAQFFDKCDAVELSSSSNGTTLKASL